MLVINIYILVGPVVYDFCASFLVVSCDVDRVV